MPKRLLPFLPAGLVVEDVRADPEAVTIVTRPRAESAACPVCRQGSDRRHSRYTRTLADLPWQGRRVQITVRARRWRCATPGCPRRVFTERLPGIAQPHGRRTRRLDDLQHHLSHALGGEAGARFSVRLGMPVSADSLLRLLRRAAPQTPDRAPRVLGVDD